MIYRTFGDLRQQVEAELDTQGEEFCTESEMRMYFNSAVTLCESTIVKLGLREKYLQTEAIVSTVAGQPSYDLPADIVANKIRKIVYRNQSTIYTMAPLRGEESYVLEDALNVNSASSDWHHWSLYKDGNIQRLRLTPTPKVTVPNALRVVYFKAVNRYTAESVLCDLPEICYEYLLSFVRYRVYAKETHPNVADEKANMQALLVLMQETLQNQVADPDMDILDGDFSHYEEMN